MAKKKDKKNAVYLKIFGHDRKIAKENIKMFGEDIEKIEELDILSESEEAGVFIVANKSRRQIFISGHLEYERNTLSDEYFRDASKGLDIEIPKNYFPNNDPSLEPIVTWRGSANVVFSNWLNYCVYQNTPYNLEEL